MALRYLRGPGEFFKYLQDPLRESIFILSLVT